MTADQPDSPASCTLDAAGRLARSAEFREFFATAVTRASRDGSTGLRLELTPDQHAGQEAGRLAVAEAACCSFFSFTLTATSGRLVLDITVPPSHAGELDTLAARVAAARPA